MKTAVLCIITAMLVLGCQSGSRNPVVYNENPVVTAGTPDGATGLTYAADPQLLTDFTRQPLNQYFGDYTLEWVASLSSGTGGNLFKLENLEVVPTYPDDDGTGYLNMTVRANKLEGAEITTFPLSKEYHYGYYLTRLKPSPVAGCINAFFTKNFTGFNDEIDIEFLTNSFGGGKGEVEFTLHPHEGVPSNQYHRVIELDFDPSQDFHEWGFVWTYDRIDYTLDGDTICTYKRSEGAPIQTHAGTIMLNVWVSANPAWGGGPPTTDATMNVDWIKFWPEASLGIADEAPYVINY